MPIDKNDIIVTHQYADTSSAHLSLFDARDNAYTRPTEVETSNWHFAQSYIAEAFSEFFGTLIFLLFGFGSVAQVVLSNGQKGEYTSLVFGWGVGVTLGILAAGKSGGHLNPGVTLAMCIFRRLSWRKFPIYVAAQTLGGFIAAAIVYAYYQPAIDVFEGPGVRTVPGFSNHSTAGIFATYPADPIAQSRAAQLFAEFMPTSILIFMVFALTDDNNVSASRYTPFGVGLVFAGFLSCFGWETGGFNFARDFGPRVLTYAVGYGSNVWAAGNNYFWVPMISPFFGAFFGGLLYDIFIYEGESPVNALWTRLSRKSQDRNSDNQV